MKTKTLKAVLLSIFAMMLVIATAFAFTACGNGSEADKDPVTKKYEATFDASINMGGQNVSFGDVINGVYVTEDNGSFTLTVIFKTGNISVFGVSGTVFVDDHVTNATTTAGITDGTLGVYNANGDLVTDGVKVTYSSGDDYVANLAKQNVYYVQSAQFPVDALRSTYALTLYINSSLRGVQFSNDTYKAELTLNLDSGEVVTEINGFGVATLGTVAEAQPEYVKYSAKLDAVVSMGQSVNFTENLFEGAYAVEKNGKYEITLIFTAGQINMPYGNVMTGFLTSVESVDYRGETVTPVFGYYNGEKLVTDGVTLTYSSDNDYVTIKGGSYYYVQSVTFTVDELKESFVLSLFVMAGNDTGASSMQFPYALNNGGVADAVLTLDLEDGETVDGIDELLGVDTLGTVPEYTKYSAKLDAVVSMGQSVNFTENLFEGAYAVEKNGKYEITLIFTAGQINMPYGNVMTGFLTSAESVDYRGETVTPVFGYYNGETLVTDGVTLTYSSGDDYVTIKGGSYYYVQSVTFTVDELKESYVLSLFVMAGNDTGASSMQFPYALNNGGVADAVLTLDLEDTETVSGIANLLGVKTLGEVEEN